MLLLERIRQYKIYRKIITSYVLLVTFAVTLVCTVLFILFSSSTAREIDTNSRSMLMQTSYTSNVVYNQVQNIANQLTIDNRIISFFYANDDKVIDYNASILLSHIMNVYPFIKYIEICSLSNGNYYNTLDIPFDQLEVCRQNTINLLKDDKKMFMVFKPRKQEIIYPNKAPQTLSTLSFILFPDYLGSASQAIIINVDEKYIQNTIRSISGSYPDFSTFVMDSDGIILSHTDSGRFMMNFANVDYAAKILNSKVSQGSFIQKIDGVKHLVTYVKSNEMNWYFVSLKPYDHLLRNIYQLRNITLLIAFLLVIAGILISVMLTGNIYNPIKSLLERIQPARKNDSPLMQRYDEYKLLSDAFLNSQEASNSMRSSIYKSSRLIKENYLLNLLKGNLGMVIAPEDILAEIRRHLTGPVYRAFIFKIDRYQNFKECNSGEDQALLRFAICNIAQELLEKHCRNDSIITEEDEIVVLGQFQETAFQEEIHLSLVEIQEAVKNYFNFTISVGIGDAVFSLNDISLSCKSAQEYIKYRLFQGYECIVDAEKVKQLNTGISKYPSAVEKILIEALQLNDLLKIQKACEKFIKSICRVSYYQAINYSNQLVLAVFKHFEVSVDLLDDDYKDYFDIMNQISGSETISDIQVKINEFCMKMSLLLNEKNNRLTTQKHRKIIEDVKEYVMAHYTDPGLSLEIVSDIVGLSPGYFGKLFKSMTNNYFSDYLSFVRLEKAKAMLSTTNEPASRICEKVGLYNITYFSTLFKKTYGVTPSQYREQSAMKYSK